MYIEFAISKSEGIQTMAFVVSKILQELESWSTSNGMIKYRTKIIKNSIRLTFDDDFNYSFFCLTWNPKHLNNFWVNYRIIRDLNNKI